MNNENSKKIYLRNIEFIANQDLALAGEANDNREDKDVCAKKRRLGQRVGVH